MSDNQNFGFGKFVPGFDFLQNIAKGASQTLPQMPNLSNWVAPTLNVEELEKRIGELKAVHFWLDQNSKALGATIQALEVQKMTLATLKGMNFNMGDVANALKLKAADTMFSGVQKVSDTAAGAANAISGVAAKGKGKTAAKKRASAKSAPATGVVDPMQWWGALTQQFQQIASSALQDASQLKMPAVAQPIADAVGEVMSAAARPSARKTGAAAKKAPAAAKKTTARKRTRAR